MFKKVLFWFSDLKKFQYFFQHNHILIQNHSSKKDILRKKVRLLSFLYKSFSIFLKIKIYLYINLYYKQFYRLPYANVAWWNVYNSLTITRDLIWCTIIWAIEYCSSCHKIIKFNDIDERKLLIWREKYSIIILVYKIYIFFSCSLYLFIRIM